MAKPRKIAKKRFKSAPPIGMAPLAPSRRVIAAFRWRYDAVKGSYDKAVLALKGLNNTIKEKMEEIQALRQPVPTKFALKPIEEAPKANGFNSFVHALDETLSVCRRVWWSNDLSGEGFWVDEDARVNHMKPIVPKFWVAQAAN